MVPAAALVLLLSAGRLAAAPLPSPPSSPSSADSNPLAAKVQKAYERVKDLSADFTQESYLKADPAKAVAKTSGKVWIAKPGKMRWEYGKPEPKTIVSDGKTMWMYDEGENQVMVNEHMEETEPMTALNFLEGLGTLEKSFLVKSIDAPAGAADAKASFLALTPKSDEDIPIAELDLGVDPKTGLADEVFLVDQLGNRTHLAFTHVKANKGVPAKTFTFVPPKGAQVIQPTVLRPGGE